jgi:hypothetical protein
MLLHGFLEAQQCKAIRKQNSYLITGHRHDNAPPALRTGFSFDAGKTE